MQNKIGIFSLPADVENSNDGGVRYVKTTGCAALELSERREDLNANDFALSRHIREVAEEYQIVLPCFSTVASLYGAKAEADVEKLKRYVDALEIMGVPLLHHTLVPELDYKKCTAPFHEVLKEIIPRVREVYDYAEQKGVRCVYEDQGYYVNGMKRFGEFLEALNRPAGVVLDLGNIYFSGEDILPFAECFMDRIVHVHIKDYRFLNPVTDKKTVPSLATLRDVRPGTGDVPVKETLQLLKQRGFEGYCMLEYGMNKEEQQKAVQAVREMLQ